MNSYSAPIILLLQLSLLTSQIEGRRGLFGLFRAFSKSASKSASVPRYIPSYPRSYTIPKASDWSHLKNFESYQGSSRLNNRNIFNYNTYGLSRGNDKPFSKYSSSSYANAVSKSRYLDSGQSGANIGSGARGSSMQGGLQRSPPPYSSINAHGTSIAHARPPPPPYTPNIPRGSPPSYSFHFPNTPTPNFRRYDGPPPAYSQASHFGMGTAYYPRANNFGYPGGSFVSSGSNFWPTYHGLRLFRAAGGGYGYQGSGNWGVQTYGDGKQSESDKMVKGALLGAAGGYLAGSLVNRISNPWNYDGFGYGHGYMDRYRYVGVQNSTNNPTAVDSNKNYVNCVSYDPSTRATMINANCTCSVTVTKDPVSGQDISRHDCVTNHVGEKYALVTDVLEHKRREIYLQLEKIVNMGSFTK